MKKYYGGINFEKFLDRVMTAHSSEVAGIKKEFEDLLARQKATQLDDTPSFKIKNEKKVHPSVVITSDYKG